MGGMVPFTVLEWCLNYKIHVLFLLIVEFYPSSYE